LGILGLNRDLEYEDAERQYHKCLADAEQQLADAMQHIAEAEDCRE
jgi:hypothetical protein